MTSGWFQILFPTKSPLKKISLKSGSKWTVRMCRVVLKVLGSAEVNGPFKNGRWFEPKWTSIDDSGSPSQIVHSGPILIVQYHT